MARKIEVLDDISVNYKKLRQIVDEVTRKYGVEVILDLPKTSDDISF